MNRRFAATMELQRPEGRSPASLIGRDVCPHCKRLVTTHGFAAPDGHRIETYHCDTHGDIVPMRSHVINHG